MGRNRTPTALKIATNMPSAHRGNKFEPVVEMVRTAPPPPEGLLDMAREEWKRVAQEMIDVGMLAYLDLSVLALYCDSFRTWRLACDIMALLELKDPQTKGMMVQSAGGSVYMNPILAVKQSSGRDMARYAAALGLTPAGRATIVAGERGGQGGRSSGGKGTDLAAKYGI